MKTFAAFRLQLLIGVAVCSFLSRAQATGPVLFSDNFDTGASPLWGNERGNWAASGGVYYATVINNNPASTTSLPLNLTDFAIDVDVHGVHDGGVYLRSTPNNNPGVGITGVLLNLKNPNFGFGNIYWHIVTNGVYSPVLNDANASYSSGGDVHLHIEVIGNTYSAYVNGSSTPATTLTTSLFSNGGVALYDFSSQTFDNVVISTVPEPAAGMLMAMGAGAWFCGRRRVGKPRP
jgi:hypothetical protein